MSDIFSQKKRSEIMSKVRSEDTYPEVLVRRKLHHLGFRYSLHRRDLPGTPDIVLPKYRTVVFINGCFWHGHNCKRPKTPKSHTDYWKKKFKKNQERDRRNIATLLSSDWRCAVVWECALKSIYSDKTISAIADFIISGHDKLIVIGETFKDGLEISFEKSFRIKSLTQKH